MKLVNMQTVALVHSGEPWRHEQPPCSRQMMQYLEKNEGVVTWVQPNAGTVQDQFPVIRVGEKYYTMSLRMMKAVWRNTRLRKGFVNLEKAPFGGQKLRIPSLLFVEKMRTQSRFNLMRMETTTTTTATAPSLLAACTKERKLVHNASSKVSLVVHKMLLPLLDTPMRSHVVFDVEEDQAELDLVAQMNTTRPSLLDNPALFVEQLQALFHRYKVYSQGYTALDS